MIKREMTGEHCVEDHTEAPYVDLVALVMLIADKFRRSIVWTTTRSSQPVRWTLLDAGHAEISDLGFSALADENVLWFEIAVTDVEGMAILDGTKHLSEQIHCMLFIKRATSVNHREQITPLYVFKDKVAKSC